MTKAVLVRRINGDQITVRGIDRRGNPTVVTRHAIRGMVTNPDERASARRQMVADAMDSAQAELARATKAHASVEAIEKKIADLKGKRRGKVYTAARKMLKAAALYRVECLASATLGVQNAGVQAKEIAAAYPVYVPVVFAAAAKEEAIA